MAVHHYMVDYEDGAGNVRFANDTELFDLRAASALAKAESRKHGRAAVVAYDPDPKVGTFVAVGHVMFSDGQQSDVDGVLV